MIQSAEQFYSMFDGFLKSTAYDLFECNLTIPDEGVLRELTLFCVKNSLTYERSPYGIDIYGDKRELSKNEYVNLVWSGRSGKKLFLEPTEASVLSRLNGEEFTRILKSVKLSAERLKYTGGKWPRKTNL